MTRVYKPVERQWRPCRVCGKATKGRSDKLYCSNVCRVRAQRSKHG